MAEDNYNYDIARSQERRAEGFQHLRKASELEVETLQGIEDYRQQYENNVLAFETSAKLQRYFNKFIRALPYETYTLYLVQSKSFKINEEILKGFSDGLLKFSLWRVSAELLRGSTIYEPEYLNLKMLMLLAEVLERKIDEVKDDLNRIMHQNKAYRLGYKKKY